MPVEIETLDGPGSEQSQRGPIPVEDEIYAMLTRGVIAKQIRPGSRIREAALAAEFGVGRARVRRVLLRLAEIGMVEFQINLGATVIRPTPDEARATFELRRVLEAEAIRRAVQRAPRDTLEAMREIVTRERIAHQRGEVGLTSISSNLHLALAGICGNPLLDRMLTQVVNRCVLMQALYEKPAQNTVCLVEEHAKILESVIARRTEEAVCLMDAHLDHLEDSLDYSNGSFSERLSPAIG